MAEAVAAVELGSLLPALHLQQGRALEAARAFFELATRPALTPPSQPAAPAGDNGSEPAGHGAGAPSARALELRLNFFQQAVHAARLAVSRLGGAEAAAALAHVSPMSRPHLAHISPTSRPHLPGGRRPRRRLHPHGGGAPPPREHPDPSPNTLTIALAP